MDEALKYMVLYTEDNGNTAHQTFDDEDASSRCYKFQEQREGIPVWGHCNPTAPETIETMREGLRKLQLVKIKEGEG